MAHGFSLVAKSLTAHPWAAAVIACAQRLVTYFRASHRTLSLFNKKRLEQGIAVGLATSTATRFNSVIACLQSVYNNKITFLTIERMHASEISVPAVLTTLGDDEFWKVRNRSRTFAKCMYEFLAFRPACCFAESQTGPDVDRANQIIVAKAASQQWPMSLPPHWPMSLPPHCEKLASTFADHLHR